MLFTPPNLKDGSFHSDSSPGFKFRRAQTAGAAVSLDGWHSGEDPGLGRESESQAPSHHDALAAAGQLEKVHIFRSHGTVPVNDHHASWERQIPTRMAN